MAASEICNRSLIEAGSIYFYFAPLFPFFLFFQLRLINLADVRMIVLPSYDDSIGATIVHEPIELDIHGCK